MHQWNKIRLIFESGYNVFREPITRLASSAAPLSDRPTYSYFRLLESYVRCCCLFCLYAQSGLWFSTKVRCCRWGEAAFWTFFFVSSEQSQYCDYALETKKMAKKHSHLICSIWHLQVLLLWRVKPNINLCNAGLVRQFSADPPFNCSTYPDIFFSFYDLVSIL